MRREQLQGYSLEVLAEESMEMMLTDKSQEGMGIMDASPKCANG